MHAVSIGDIVRETRRRGLFGEETPVLGLYDLDLISEKAKALIDAFSQAGAQANHFFAVKAAAFSPIVELLLHEGIGVETASPGELNIALRAGASAKAIVVDSPAKTRSEIDTALALGLNINIDSFAELSRIEDYLRGRPCPHPIGLRINPQTGAGSIASTSTATLQSKFGIPLRVPDNRERLISAYQRNPFLNQIHVHTGSQGCGLDLISESIAVVKDLADEINARLGKRQITRFDLGGGLPVSQYENSEDPTFSDYVAAVRDRVPDLFRGSYTLMTEFGRALVAEAGFALARVEYTKVAGDRNIAVTHAGAQLLSRTTFAPQSWPIDVDALDFDGQPKTTPRRVQDVAGPCCFAGDLVVRERTLPELEEGDVIALKRIGAYGLSTHYRYNELPPPPVVGFRRDATGLTFHTLRSAPPDFNLLNREFASPHNPSSMSSN